MAFVTAFGVMGPKSHQLPTTSQDGQDKEIRGQKVVMGDLRNKNYSDFVSLNLADNSFRPVGIAFNGNENALYIGKHWKS